jgi:hypothetical protein
MPEKRVGLNILGKLALILLALVTKPKIFNQKIISLVFAALGQSLLYS